MILTGSKIKEEINSGKIIIEPYDVNSINPNSYNYTLGNFVKVYKENSLDSKVKEKVDIIEIPDDGLVLEPNKVYLGSTMEVIGSDKYVTQLIGRSSIGRLGLFLQVTAPLGHVGCKLNWTLELKVVQPLKVYSGMKIGQVTFWCMDGNDEINYKNGKYNMDKPNISKFYEEVK